MEQSQVMYRMAEYFRTYGFSVHMGKHGGPRCFMGAFRSVCGECTSYDAVGPLLRYIGGVQDESLARAGWNTARAIAICQRVGDELAPAEAELSAKNFFAYLRDARAAQDEVVACEEVV